MILLLLFAGLGAIFLQMQFSFSEVRPWLIALPVVYAAMRRKDASPFYLAVLLGTFIDILSPQKFGTGAIVLCVVVGATWSQRENFHFELYRNVPPLALLATFVALVVDYALFCWQSGNWDWHFVRWVRMAWMAVVNLILSIPFFWICDCLLIVWNRQAQKNRNRESDPRNYVV